ncbi:MAG: element excision factor XisI family protein, partial [Chloroflexota bacterium]
VDLYAGKIAGGTLFPVLDDHNQTYAVLYVNDKYQDRPAWVVVMARVVGDYVVIDEDTTDKPLVDALMINGGIPREQIVLAYAGETLPEPQTK